MARLKLEQPREASLKSGHQKIFASLFQVHVAIAGFRLARSQQPAEILLHVFVRIRGSGQQTSPAS